MRDVLAFSDKTSQETEVNTELQEAVEKEQYDNVQATVIQNNTLRSHKLQWRKKKFYSLRYKKEALKPRETFDQAYDFNQRDTDSCQHENGNNKRSHHSIQWVTAPWQPQDWSNQRGRSNANAVSKGSMYHQHDPPMRIRSRQNCHAKKATTLSTRMHHYINRFHCKGSYLFEEGRKTRN